MKLLVGLGNPGKKYEGTRHNMGFMTLDLFSDVSKIDIDREAFQGMIGRGKLFGEDVMLFKPTTFMNLSGHAVSEVVNYFKIDVDDVVVVYDDMALETGTIRLRLSGSSGGQKGMQNIIEQLGTEKIKRIRVGIGEPEDDSVDYVLSKPLKEEKELIDKAIEKAKDALVMYLKKDFDAAMNTYNRGDA